MIDRKQGTAFDDDDVARAYAFRPAYPEAMYEFLFGLIPRHDRALDLGCGPGKIAHDLARQFRSVDAVDPSLPMLRLADNGNHSNITWIHTNTETAPLAASYDLVTAGASMHWMDHAVVFPRLAAVLVPDGCVAVIEGDDAHEPSWRSEWEAFMSSWLQRLGGFYDPASHRRSMTSFQEWMLIREQRTFEQVVTQKIEHFIECQHSRATWSRANLGPECAGEFDRELFELLVPHATDGAISFTVRTRVVCGVPLAR